MSSYKKTNKYIDFKVDGRLFPSWVLANFKKDKRPEGRTEPNIEACKGKVEQDN